MFVTKVRMETAKRELDNSLSVRFAWVRVARNITYDDAVEHATKEFGDHDFKIEWEDDEDARSGTVTGRWSGITPNVSEIPRNHTEEKK